MQAIVNFLFEAVFLKKLSRTGFSYLGSGNESVAEHTCGTLFIAYALGYFSDGIDMNRLLKMCLFHDLPEARIGDQNYVNKKYVKINENKALADLSIQVPFGEEIVALVEEFNEKKTLESKIANDADQLDLILHLKREADIGNSQTKLWLEFAFERLLTDQARQLARIAMETDSSDWWLSSDDLARET